MEATFWILIGLVATAMGGYGVAVIALAALLPRRPPLPPMPISATLLIAAHNEEACIGDKVAGALAQDVGPHRLSVFVVSDGSTDRTAEIVRQFDASRVELLEIAGHGGKIAALNQALSRLAGDVVIFSDANSRLADGALRALLDRFGDEQVGGVCGALGVETGRSGWLGQAEKLYWRYDNALKRAESDLGGTVSAQGSLYAVRRALIQAIPLSVADDFYVSTQVVAHGRKLVFEPRAVALEPVSSNVRGEFGRRVRSTERGWRALLMMRRLLRPSVTGSYAVRLFFHKFLRRMVPFLLVALFGTSAALVGEHWFYAAAFGAQAAAYAIALGAAVHRGIRRLPGTAFLFFFVATQIAMAFGLIRFAFGHHSRSWKPVRDLSADSGSGHS